MTTVVALEQPEGAEWDVAPWAPPSPNGDKPANGMRDRVLIGREICNLPPPTWHVAGVIAQPSLTVVYGPPDSGKTFVVLALAGAIASGGGFLGEKVTAQAPALYVAAEGTGGLGARFHAWCEHANIDDAPAFYWLPAPVNLTDDRAVAELAGVIHELQPGLVVLDTLARCSVGADENSAKDMGVVVAALDHLRDVARSTVVAIHHTGKDTTRGARGSNALLGAADTAIEITRDNNSVKVRCERQKDAPAFETRYARLEPVGGSVVAVPAAGEERVPESVWDVLGVLHEIDDGSGVSASAWEASADVSRRSFFRAKKLLVERGFVIPEGRKFRGTNRGRDD